MKTKEFIKKVEELGFGVRFCGMQIRILANDFIISVVYTGQVYGINTCKPLSIALKNEDKLFELMVEYVKTPLDERKEEEKYFYEHKFIKTRGGNPTYLAIRQRPNNKYPILQGSYKDIFEYKVEFTDKEMEEAKNKYWICLDDFVKKSIIEVEIWIRFY